MTEKRGTIFDYLEQVFICFGFTMLCMVCITYICGEAAKEYSTMFALGNTGVPVGTMLKFLVLSFIEIFLKEFFISDIVFKRMNGVLRIIFMLASILFVMVLFIIAFKWFPIRMWEPWVLFLLCFAACVIGSLTVSVVKTKLENKKLANALSRLKAELGDEQNGGKVKNE